MSLNFSDFISFPEDPLTDSCCGVLNFDSIEVRLFGTELDSDLLLSSYVARGTLDSEIGKESIFEKVDFHQFSSTVGTLNKARKNFREIGSNKAKF